MSAVRVVCGLFLLILTLFPAEVELWQNGWDAPLSVQCGTTGGFYRVRSTHSNYYEDRLWQWDCRDDVAQSEFNECYWTGYINGWREPIFGECEPDYILHGLYSYHWNNQEDRRWNLRCCKATNHFTRNCEISSFTNNYDTNTDYTVAAPRVITGIFSGYAAWARDRIWSFESCEYTQCTGGLTCQTENACEHESNVVDGELTCSCFTGYTLGSNDLSCIDNNECDTNNGGCSDTCINSAGSFHCFCPEGYELDDDGLTCIDIDECAKDVHGCEQNCENTIGLFNCSCYDGYYVHGNNASCIDINECDDDDNGGCTQDCDNYPGGYNCSCSPGYWLKDDGKTCLDVNECLVDNGGCEHTCHNTPGGSYCSCDQGYTINEDDHVSCEDYNECIKDGGESHQCAQICINTVGSYKCDCNAGYLSYSVNCIDIDECSNSGCEQYCNNTEGSFNCYCDKGYTLDGTFNCTDINECLVNNGGCSNGCQNTIGSYQCYCFTDGYTLDSDGTSCIDINECEVSNGRCEHTCTNTIGSRMCSCNEGYQVVNEIFCFDVNECDTNNGGCDHTCVNSIGSYQCLCNDGYGLADDQRKCLDMNECDTNNGGCEHNCTNTDGGFSCSCMDGYNLDREMFCTGVSTTSARILESAGGVGLSIAIPVILIICIVVVIAAVIITVLVMKRRQLTKADLNQGTLSGRHGVGVRGLYPEDTGNRSPSLHRYDPDSVSMSSLKKVLEEDTNY